MLKAHRTRGESDLAFLLTFIPAATSTTASTPGRVSGSFEGRGSVVKQAAVCISIFVESPHTVDAQVREIVPKLFEFLFAQDIGRWRFGGGSAGHGEPC